MMDVVLSGRIYLSRAVMPFDVVSLRHLAERASVANKAIDVTGFLVHRDGSFVQYVEGPEDPVAELIDRISADERHHVSRLEVVPCDDRRFEDWGMQLLDPLWMPTRSAHDTLHELLGIPWPDDAKLLMLGELQRSIDRIASEHE